MAKIIEVFPFNRGKMIYEDKKAMRLITKLPEEKDPVIGIEFVNETEGQRLNEDLIEKYSKDAFSVTIWPTDKSGKTMNLMLINLKQTDVQRIYKDLTYDSAKLHWWLGYTGKNNQIQQFKFVHVVQEFGKHRLLTTYNSRKRFVLNVTKYVLRNEDQISI